MSFYMFYDELISNPQYSHISSDAKILYTVMSNRASLSEKNGDAWRLKDGTVFIYFTQAETMELLHCGKDKACKVTKELQQVKLIRRIPCGQGRPHMVIVSRAFQTSKTKRSAQRNTSSPDCDKSDTNNTDRKNLEKSYMESTLPQERWMLEEEIKDNIHYDILSQEMDTAILDSIVNIIVDTLYTPADTIIIGGQQRRFCDVSARFLNLNDLHIRHAYSVIRDNPNPIRYPKAFLLKLLFEANWAMCI